MLTFIAEPGITETIIFLTYILTCAALFKPRFSPRATLLSFSAAAILIVGAQTALFLSGEKTLALTLLPLTAYLPFSVLLYFLSDYGLFETLAVCSLGTLAVLILKSLNKIIHGFFSQYGVGIGVLLYAAANCILLLAAAGLVFIAFACLRKNFSFCVGEHRKNRLLLSVPVLSVFLMISYYLNSTTDVIVLFFTMITTLSVFVIVAGLLNSTAQLIRARRSEKKMSEYMEIQRRGYDGLVRKMEAGRVYRHDMRHHLTVIEGLVKQGDFEKVLEYTGKMNGTLDGFENVSYCPNPEINAVLSEYIARAEKAGCKVTVRKLLLPDNLPFAADDVCMVLANSVENAMNACSDLPPERRYIEISAELADGRRLLISVKNPCSDIPEFDANDLPVSRSLSEEHGIGLRSVKSVAEKYNGFLRCKLENGEFVLHTAMFYEKPAHEEKKTGVGTVPKRALSSLLSIAVGALIVLNLVPDAAEAASSFLSVNIKPLRSFFRWGDSSIDMEYPVFEGNGAEEINASVSDYIAEARAVFMRYFDRKYNGYAAEDMRYTVIRDDEQYFIVRFDVTVNAGGSLSYSRWTVFDKNAAKVLELSDLFDEGSDYISHISAEILRQMKEKNESGLGDFYTEGEDAFTEISADANFYIDSFDRIVIVFDEYEVAPGSMGCPEFYIKKQLLEGIMR